jgi:amidase
MLDAANKPAPGDPFVITQPRQPYLKEIDDPTGKLRVACTAEAWTGADVNPENADCVRNIARICEEMGHNVEEAMPRFDLEPYFSALGVMWNSSLGFTCDQLAQKMGRPADIHHLEPVTLAAYNNSREISAADVLRARAALNMTRRKIGAFFEKYDLLLIPTTAQLPVSLDTINQNQDIPIEAWYLGTSQFNAFTNLSNATGLPAISLPLGQSSTGLPVGIQFMAGFGEESLLLRIAATFEEAMPWKDRLPPLHVSR